MRQLKIVTLILLSLAAWSCGQEQPSKLSDTGFVDTPWWSYDKPSDRTLSTRHALAPYFRAGKEKKLALNYFRDLISSNSDIAIKYGEWPKYQPGWFSGGTIYHPAVNKPFSKWGRLDWSSFYNELFHAWWGNVFMKDSRYAFVRQQILTTERKQHYRQAHPSKPLLAQEEAYSETVAALMIYAAPQYNPHGPESRFYDQPYFTYQTGKTVSPVSHSDRPGFTPAAETTYPNQFEYKVMFRILFDADAPE
jgi:hypothetical protein